MGATKVRGSSYRTLVSYLKGDTTPSPAWLREASRILDVSRTWLEHDVGPMIPDPLAESRARDGNQLERTMSAFNESLEGSGLPYQSVHPQIFWAFADLLERFSLRVHGEHVEDLPKGDPEVLARHLMLGVYSCLSRLTGHTGQELEVTRDPNRRIGLAMVLQGLAVLTPPGRPGPSMPEIREAVEAEWQERYQAVEEQWGSILSQEIQQKQEVEELIDNLRKRREGEKED